MAPSCLWAELQGWTKTQQSWWAGCLHIFFDMHNCGTQEGPRRVILMFSTWVHLVCELSYRGGHTNTQTNRIAYYCPAWAVPGLEKSDQIYVPGFFFAVCNRKMLNILNISAVYLSELNHWLSVSESVIVSVWEWQHLNFIICQSYVRW